MIPDKDVLKKSKIPNGSTPIKNDILIEIIAKGKLDLTEIRIVAYIIRYSWGFTNGDGRQNWTKPTKISEMAKDIGISRSLCSRVINKMVKENKLFIKDNCYQFNEHFDTWKVLTKSNAQEVLTKSNAKCELKVTPMLTKSNALPQENSIPINDIRNLKETFKENKRKDNTINSIKQIKKNNLLDSNNILSSKDKKETKKELSVSNGIEVINIEIPKRQKVVPQAIQLLADFCSLMDITFDRGFIERNVRDANKILKDHKIEDILGLVNWVKNNDSFWSDKIYSFSTIYKNYAVWEKQFKDNLKSKLTVGQWLAKHKEYKPQNPQGSFERYRELLRIFNLAFKDKNVIPTLEEWEKYHKIKEKLTGGINGTNQ